MGRCSNGVGHC